MMTDEQLAQTLLIHRLARFDGDIGRLNKDAVRSLTENSFWVATNINAKIRELAAEPKGTDGTEAE